MKSVTILVLLGLLGVSYGSIISNGQCSESVQALQNFNLDAYLGVWHEIAKTPTIFQEGGECSNANYTFNPTGGYVDVYNTMTVNNILSVDYGIGTVNTTDGSAQLAVTFGQPEASPYWVLETDYVSFALVYSCSNIDANQRSITMWKLSRTKTMTELVNAFLNVRINEIDGISATDLVETDQSDEACLALIDSAPGEPVIGVGQCPPVAGVPNFEPARYAGLWNTISSYYSESSAGECGKARYTVNAQGTVDVLNSQVLNQNLDTISGTASLASTDGSGILLVDFPSIGLQQILTIVATDYDNYALAYSCANLDAERFRVFAFKLSRTKTLSEASAASLLAVTENIPTLNERFYVTVDQSDEACFYYPEVVTGATVIFPGQCDETISVVQNFNPTLYAGRWYDITSYHSTFQTGECNDAFYTITPEGTVDVFNTQVIDQTLDTITGVAVLASTDGSAKLNVTFPVAGTDFSVSTPYWVLSTDYVSYSYVYTCVNLNEDERAVYAWKLSRTKTLTAAAETAINAVTNSVDVLDERYFVANDLSDEACFYYPEANGQPLVFRGQCDLNIPVVTGFSVANYLGFWYDIESYPSVFAGGDCKTANYSLNANGTVNVYNTQVLNQFFDDITGVAVLDSTIGEAKLSVTFNVGGFEIVTPYWVLATDYTSYALVYTCYNIDAETRSVSTWKLSRTPTLSAAANTAINTAIGPIDVLDPRYYRVTDQTEEACRTLPFIEPGEPVVFDGQCDESIATVANFDPTRYVGTWYDIAHYTSEFLEGTCNTAEYTLTPEGIVDVYNTQVINQALDSINGTAVLASTDGSGKLTVTFPIAGTTQSISTPYWILSTDYESYSLVYTCVNLSATSKRIWSWKLSRSKELTPAADAAITSVMNSVFELNEAYYEYTNLTDSGCFYFPEPSNGPVVFPGQCDANIQAVAGFAPDRYAGTWFEIEAYPSAFQFGTCATAEYTLNNEGGVDVVNSQVVNQSQLQAFGYAFLASTDGSGKLNVTFPIEGTDLSQSLDYWVLSTDYDTYALVYACSNLNANERTVWSWKLSRTKQLTAAATTAINAVVNTIDVLDARYYATNDQSDEACFYYPEANGQPLVFPGQCDLNIPVVTNFDAASYLGQWYDIASYPSVFQQGDCKTAFYSVNETSGALIVYNTQVVDSIFDDITGSAVIASTDGSAKLDVTFNIQTDFGVIDVTTSYWVLATDYTSYALVYTCYNVNAYQRAVFSWKLARARGELSAAANTAINQVVQSIDVLDDRYYEVTDNSEAACRSLPPLPEGEPVVLEGLCDATVQAQAGFNPQLYEGTWYEIARYPSPNSQFGECNTANYILGPDGVVAVYNTEVIDQSLSTINGTATLSSTDGSAQLAVNFTIEGQIVTLPYWVISTDYTSYSLVYTCVNLNDSYRQVWSWKLSRTRQLTAAAEEAINTAMEQVFDLTNAYYQTSNQSDEACFYYPEPTGVPVVFPGQCAENLQAVAGFDPTLYVGRWFEIEAYPSAFQFGSCATAQYSLNENGIVDVLNTQVVGQSLLSVVGTAVLSSTDGTGRLNVTFPIEGTDLSQSLEYWVMATDYSNYALVYACSNINDQQRTVYSWKLSRTKELTAAANTAINAVVNTIDVLDARYYEQNDQTDSGCFYYPEIVEGQTLVFPGQCDLTIPTVQPFDATRYVGEWYDVASYETPFVYGDCPTAEYALTPEGTVDVYNTQVIGTTLDTINGTASVTSTDGSAQLVVFFDVGPPQGVPYWVLATDYDSYALVYTCVNLNAEQRTVYSWKLSRTRSLTAAAETAINTVMATVDVLDERYFITRNVSDEDCFYLPNLQQGEPVIFRGQCDASLPVQMNFDATRYQGRWNEVESYGSAFQFGTCPIAQYTLNEGGFVDVYNTQVIGETLFGINGTAYVDSDDGSAKLIVLFPSTGTETTVTAIQQYWVLSTDYDSYALVYSCENVTADTRRVWSWKLSRDNTLSPNAVTAINAVVNTVNVLDERYYVAANLTDEGCFYYPEILSGEPVIFPGQCDETVQGVANFNLNAFAGDWLEISSYPKGQRADGSCPNSTFAATANGYDLFLRQVTDQFLDTRNGTAIQSFDGTGRFTVTLYFNELGFTTTGELIILATDYSSYALTYSCVNVDENYRRVVSSKLSRTDTLTAAANTAINNAVANNQVLDERYYVDSGRSEEDCFYYPDNYGGPVYLNGQCPSDAEVNVVTGFDAASYLGLWHEIEKYPSDFQVGECGNAFYELNSAGTVDVTNTLVYEEALFADYGNAFVATTDGRGILTVSFPNQATGVDNVLNYYIMDTDYNSFALVYACLNVDATRKRVFSWKLSRSKEGLTSEAQERINAAVSNTSDLYEGYYAPTRQDDAACFYYPQFEDSLTNIVLPGPCNTSITAKANFEADRYTGRWFEIARYPYSFEIGECAIARYTLSDGDGPGDVDVVNSIVYNGALEVVIGYANVISDDGTGLLEVALPIFGTDQYNFANYYVMETDYDNFALVYSCRDLEDGNRQVSSWKLGRSRTLAPEHSTIMAGVISQTQGLLEDYYVEVDQSEEACFYVPEFNAQEAVVFPGQCNEDNIVTVADFDVDRYLGVWHEIEHYPRGYEAGDCRRTEYQIVNGAYIAINTSVTNNEGTVTQNSVTVNPNGRLTKTLSNGDVVVYYVLATDYASYSLIYTCENVNDESRNVWSAKLSRSRELTNAANTAINAVVASNEVLINDFYVPVDHSDASCFFYPEIDDAVIIPGQCDDAIQAVTEFSMEEFSGRWYQTAAYPQTYETGDCISTFYTYDAATGAVTLDILQVVDGEPQEFERTASLTDVNSGSFIEESGAVTKILTTNYADYALVYSCSNVDQYSRQISAWKLSRTREMPMIGTAAINLLINLREELHEPYFVSTAQSEDCPDVGGASAVFSSFLTVLLAYLVTVCLRL